MSSRFALISASGETRLELHWSSAGRPSDDKDSRYTATLVSAQVSATVRVTDYQASRWSLFFADVAESWQGWTGERACESLQGHLRVSCVADRLGHIKLRVTLRDPFDQSRWEAQTTMLIEAGQLDYIDRTAEAFFGRPPGAEIAGNRAPFS